MLRVIHWVEVAIGLGLVGGAIYLAVAPPPGGPTGAARFVPTGMLLLFAILMFTVWAPMTRRIDHGMLLRTGKPTTATVVDVRDTGGTVNMQPVFRFTLDVRGLDGSTYRAVTDQMVSRTSLGVIRPGMVVPVRVDPRRPTKVAIDTSRPATATSGPAGPASAQMTGTNTVLTAGFPQAPGVIHSADVIRDGVRATASVRAVALTDTTFGQFRPHEADPSNTADPMVMISLEVRAADGSTFTETSVHRVPAARLSGLSPDVTLPVAYLAADPTRTTCIDWDRS